MSSEFGKGLCYNLGLFLAHAENFKGFKETETHMKLKSPKLFKNHASSMWFNGASDHLYELQDEQAPKHLRKRLGSFCSKCIGWRLTLTENNPTDKDVEWAIQEAKDLLRLIDKANGITVIKGDWE